MKLNKVIVMFIVFSFVFVVIVSYVEGLIFFFGLQFGFKYELMLVIIGGVMNVDVVNDDLIVVYGLDFNMNCGLFQIVDNCICIYIQINYVDDFGVKFIFFELLLCYIFLIGSGFLVGVGLVIVLVSVDNGDNDKNFFGYGVVVGVNFCSGVFYVGVDVCYLNIIESNDVEFENVVLLVKIGINF